MTMINNPIYNILENLGVCSKEYLIPYYPHVRDDKSITVFLCQKTKSIFLSGKSKKEKISAISEYWKLDSIEEILGVNFNDDNRRYNQYKDLVYNKDYMDIGSGLGGSLDSFKKIAKKIICIEPGPSKEYLEGAKGYSVLDDVKSAQDNSYDFVTLFHVFEHIEDPVEMLTDIHKKLRSGGRAVLEIPHAKDFLLSFLDCDEFKSFTFWSDHLVLYTRDTLRPLIEKSPFKSSYKIVSYQRYPLANHLYWLARGKPGGHKKWNYLSEGNINEEYNKLLFSLDMSDTLIIHLYKE